ncbi:hypothetical protein BHE74_00033083, partial [Ensete ventricosum]
GILTRERPDGEGDVMLKAGILMEVTPRMQWEKASGGGGDDERNDDVREGRGGGGGEAGAEGEGVGEGILCVKVMTDEQMEVLRRQIAIYSTICEKLVEMHKAITAHHDSLAGDRFFPFLLLKQKVILRLHLETF